MKNLIKKLTELNLCFFRKKSEQLICDACNSKKQINGLEDCKCGNGKMWIKQTIY